MNVIEDTRHGSRERNEHAILAALAQNGETPQTSLTSLANVPAGSIVAVCRRLEHHGQIISRQVPANAGGHPRRVWRLPDQPTKIAYDRGEANLGRQGQRRRWATKRAQQDQLASVAADETGPLRDRILATIHDAGPAGLTYDQIAQAVPGDEPRDQVLAKARQLWMDNQLVTRLDGTLIVGKSSWQPREFDDSEDDT